MRKAFIILTLQLKKYKSVNKDIEYKIQTLDKNLTYERRKINGLQSLNENGKALLEREVKFYHDKKSNAIQSKSKRFVLEKEIYELQNLVNTYQRNREQLEVKNLHLKNVREQKQKEIELLKKEITKKDIEIDQNEKKLDVLKSNINEITETAIKG